MTSLKKLLDTSPSFARRYVKVLKNIQIIQEFVQLPQDSQSTFFARAAKIFKGLATEANRAKTLMMGAKSPHFDKDCQFIRLEGKQFEKALELLHLFLVLGTPYNIQTAKTIKYLRNIHQIVGKMIPLDIKQLESLTVQFMNKNQTLTVRKVLDSDAENDKDLKHSTVQESMEQLLASKTVNEELSIIRQLVKSVSNQQQLSQSMFLKSYNDINLEDAYSMKQSLQVNDLGHKVDQLREKLQDASTHEIPQSQEIQQQNIFLSAVSRSQTFASVDEFYAFESKAAPLLEMEKIFQAFAVLLKTFEKSQNAYQQQLLKLMSIQLINNSSRLVNGIFSEYGSVLKLAKFLNLPFEFNAKYIQQLKLYITEQIAQFSGFASLLQFLKQYRTELSSQFYDADHVIFSRLAKNPVEGSAQKLLLRKNWQPNKLFAHDDVEGIDTELLIIILVFLLKLEGFEADNEQFYGLKSFVKDQVI